MQYIYVSMTVRHVVVEPFRSRKRECREDISRRAAMKGMEGQYRESAQSRERLQRDGFNDTKYKIVLTLDRLKAS